MNEDLRLSPRGAALIMGFEKCRLKAYKPTPNDKWSVGFGNTFYDNGQPVKEGDVITQQRAEELFVLLIPTYEKMVRSKIRRLLFQNEFDALVSFAYNAGTGYKEGGKQRDFLLWFNVNTRMTGQRLFDYWTACAISQAGRKLPGLIRRRKSEVTMFLYSKLDFFE